MSKGIIARILEYYLVPDHAWMFGVDVERALTDFFGEQRGYIDAEATQYFTDWFLFDFVLASGKTPMQYVCDTDPLKFLPEEMEACRSACVHNRYDFFEVKKIMRRRGMTFESVRTGETFEVHDKSAMKDTRLGDVFVCRIIKIGDAWEIANPSALAMSNPSVHDKERMKNFPMFGSRVAYHEIVVPERGPVGDFGVERLEDGEMLATGMTGNVSQEEEDDCAVCQASRAAKQKGRAPTMDELKKAFKKSGGAFNKNDYSRGEGG